MTREEVFTLIQSHLADHLDVDPARIDEGTPFKEDLEADPLDLHTLVQELGRAAPQGIGQSASTLVTTERVLASVIEAVIGACYLHAGYEPTAEAVVEAFQPEIEHALEHPVDFKSTLQERLAQRGELVSY